MTYIQVLNEIGFIQGARIVSILLSEYVDCTRSPLAVVATKVVIVYARTQFRYIFFVFNLKFPATTQFEIYKSIDLGPSPN